MVEKGFKSKLAKFFSIKQIFIGSFQFIGSALFYVIIGNAVLFSCPSVDAADNPQSSDILTLRTDQKFYEIGQHVELLADATAELTIQQVSSESMSTRFTPVRSKNINLGISESAFWFRFSIRRFADTSPKKSWYFKIDRCGLTHCELFFARPSADQLDSRNQWEVLKSNQADIIQKRFVCRPIVFPLPPLKTQPTIFYLRVHNPESGLYLPFSIATKEAISDSLRKTTLWLGLYYGSILAMLLFNLYLYISLRETVQLYYICYIISVVLYFMFKNKILFDYINDGILHHRFNFAALGLTIFWGTGFAKYFLNTKKHAPYMNKLLSAIMIVSASILLITPFTSIIFLKRTTSFLGMVSPFVIIVSGITCWRRGFRSTLFFLIAWSILCVGGLIYALTYRGSLPYTVLTYYSFQIASCLEVVILSFALGENIKNLRRERDSIRQTFGKYVSDEVCDQILSGNIPLDGEIKEVTVLISDLRDYTPLVESTPPKDLVKITNMYLEAMAKTIEKNRGLILQYVGDSIQAVFGAPVPIDDHPKLAVRTALEMRAKLISVNDRLQERGFKKLRHGIGIHTGKVTAANIGSPERLSYSLSGVTVNVASRLQNLTKKFNTDILVSKTTMDFIKDEIQVKRFGQVVLRGLSDSLEILGVR